MPIRDSALKGLPFGQWQLVEVTFPPTANQDLVIPHELTVEGTEKVRWIVVSKGSIGVPSPSEIYEDLSIARRSWGKQNIVLRCTEANVKATLLLVVML